MDTDKKKSAPAKKNVHEGHRERMRQRFLKNGINVFDDYQALEFLLYFVYKRKDTNEIGHALINEFSNLENVFGASYDNLLKVEGVGPMGAALISFVGQLRNKIIIDSSDDNIVISDVGVAGEYCCEQLKFLTNERLILLSLNSNRKLIATDIISEGTANSTSADICKIANTVMKRGATSAILAHNHPGDSTYPSENDIAVTVKVMDLFKGINVMLIDHIICSGDKFTSMSDRGLM